MVFDRQPARSQLPVSHDVSVSHLHLKERSSIPSLLRHTDGFAITRVESSSGLADPITKVSNVPALLVSVSIKSLAMGEYQLWIDDKLVPTPYIPAFRSNVIDFDAQPSCWPGSAFDYVLFHVPRKGLDDIAADLAVDPVETYRLSLDEEDLVLTQLTKSILPYIGRQGWPCPSGTGPPQSDPRRSCAPEVRRIANAANALGRRLGALAETPCDRVAERESGGANPALCSWRRSAVFRSATSPGHSRRASVSRLTRWLVQRRIERSQELLMHTRESLADIAEQAGFSDQAAFTRTFHQIVGISPGRWRRDHQPRESHVSVA